MTHMDTYEKIKDAISEFGLNVRYSRKQIESIVKRKYGNMEVIPSDYCYNRVNDGIDLQKNLAEKRCLFIYEGRNAYVFVGSRYNYEGEFKHKPKGEKEYVAGLIKNGRVVWQK